MKKIVYLLKLLALTVVNPGFFLALLSGDSPSSSQGLLFAFLASLAQAFALAEVVRHQRGIRRWPLIWKTALLFYGVTFFHSGIEAALFLSYMQTTMTTTELVFVFIYGAVLTVIITPVAVFLFRKDKEPVEALTLPFRPTAIRVGLLSLSYMVIYFLFGAFVFIPLAGEHFDAFYGSMQEPSWLFPFQIIRGFLWVLLILGLMRLLPADRKKIIYLVTLFIALPFSSLLLPDNPIMPEPIRMAHLVEVLASMLVFGFLCAWLLTKPTTQLKGKSSNN